MEENNYLKFLMMLTGSFLVMYGVMFLNAHLFDHVYLSVTRVYMTLLMVSPMALIMLFVMRSMYKNRTMNVMITIVSIAVFVAALFFLRTQAFIKDVQYMKAMIPHHSSAILTSERAEISDPEVKELAREIIKSQEEEIAHMKALLKRLEK